MIPVTYAARGTAPAPGTDTQRGNWIWLPSVGAPVEAWGFAVPGGWASTTFNFPGANGNYTNGEAIALLGMSANCDPSKETSRQSTTNRSSLRPTLPRRSTRMCQR